MATAKLYELVIGERRALEELLEETGGEFTPEIEQLMDELELKRDDKLERVGVYYKEQLGDAERCKLLAAHYGARAKSYERGAEGLKSYAESMMRIAGVDKLKCPLVSLSIQHNPPSVKGDLTQEALRELAVIEPTLVRQVPEIFSLDRRAALDYHKAGHALPDGLAVEQGSSLRIR